jgi:hypothetical protein
MRVIFRERDFSRDLLPLPLTYRVGWLSHSVFGGPKAAEISAIGADLALWELIEYVRRPVDIYNDQGERVWWGFVAQVDLQVGTVKASVGIDTMFNRIAVAYTSDEFGRQTTAWAQDEESVTEYGIRELLMTISGSSADHAEAARTMAIAQKRFPIPTIQPGQSKVTRGQVTLRCRGWWSTLDWKYYSAATASTDTATQVQDIADTAGQFFSAVEVEAESGIDTDAARDGDGKGLFEAEELLVMGTANYRRMLARLDPSRILTIYEEPAYSPASDTNLMMDSRGELFDRFRNPLRRDTCPVGAYVRLVDVIPGSVDTSRLSDPGLAFIDEMEYRVVQYDDQGRVRRDALVFRARDVEDPWNIGRPRDG